MASTVPYPAEEEPVPAAPLPTQGTKRDAPTPESGKKEKVKKLQSPSPQRDTGARSSTDGAPILPLRDDDSEDEDHQEPRDEAALVMWAEDIEAEMQRRGDEDVTYEKAYAELPTEIEAVIKQVGAEKITRIELGFEGSMARCHEKGASLVDGDILVFEVSEDGAKAQTIVRETGTLSKDELVNHKVAVDAGKLKEIKGLHDLGCFKRFPTVS